MRPITFSGPASEDLNFRDARLTPPKAASASAIPAVPIHIPPDPVAPGVPDFGACSVRDVG